MKRVMLILSDKEHEQLSEKKDGKTWEQYVLDLAEVKRDGL